jgi:hypothetical protein
MKVYVALLKRKMETGSEPLGLERVAAVSGRQYLAPRIVETSAAIDSRPPPPERVISTRTRPPLATTTSSSIRPSPAMDATNIKFLPVTGFLLASTAVVTL